MNDDDEPFIPYPSLKPLPVPNLKAGDLLTIEWPDGRVERRIISHAATGPGRASLSTIADPTDEDPA